MAPYDDPHASVDAAVTSVPTDIQSDFMYRIPRGFHEYVVDLELDLDALRLLHALIHATCREVRNWYRNNFELPAGGHARACVAIKTLLGTAAANDNRSLTRGAEILRQTWLFDVLSFEHRCRVVRWKFSDIAEAWLFRDDEYGLFDIRRLADLRTALALRLHTEVGLVRRMRRPQCAFAVPDLCAELRAGGVPSWARLRKPFVGSLQKIAARENMRFVVLLHWQYVLPGIDTVIIRAEHMHSTWQRPQLFKRPRGRGQTTRALVIDATTVRDVALTNLPDAVEPVAAWRARLTAS
ncbi:hypothetical protein NHN26_14260 [Rhodovulum tesquicola]|uniref:hypothetical protein n=1 Tax=Rhodovulum tesquicola TaxID=540254 RepID=UPI0020977128|nr:hypothetical protein [Rhodovulum tesquicola]MCO8146388.1 hypothetical protein [Rhodovulum tesquicola]